MSEVVIYDLYCSAGGVGLAIEEIADEYWRPAGYDVTHVGVDIEDHSDKYAGEFIQADASRPPLEPGPDLLWMSPPCQAYSRATMCQIGRVFDSKEHIKEVHPTFSDLNVRGVVGELDPDGHIIENVVGCDDLREPTRINGYGVGYGFGLARLFETSFHCPDRTDTGTPKPGLFTEDTTDWKDSKALAREKGVPESWAGREIRSAIPRNYVQYLFHYCPSVPDVPLPDGVDRQTLLTEVSA